MTVDQDMSSTHPLLPPTTEDERLSWLRLLRSRRVGPSTFFRLMGEHGSAAAALDALPDVARAAGVERYAPCPPEVAAAELRAGHAAGARLICHGDPDYPADLAGIDDAPPLIWAIGDPGLARRPMIAIVGARNASSLGARMARALAADLAAAGYVVVSGLARGIDTAAHAAALESGTLAVLAGGVDVLYPVENARLAEDIAERGLRLSEQPMGMAPQARHFPRRNRIVSGLCRGVVVVEAAAKSGSLITARSALDQGREVLAVPGHPFDARAAGCNMLLRDGAVLVRGAADVLEALPPTAPAPRTDQPQLDLEPPGDAPGAGAGSATDAPIATVPAPPPQRRSLRDTAALHSAILQRLGPSPVAEDQLIRDLDAPARTVAPALVDLELDGKIRRSTGGMLALN